MEEKEFPAWYQRGKVDEVNFCRQFAMKHFIAYDDGAFFGIEGRIYNEDALRQQIYLELAPYLSQGLARKVDSILGTMRMECRQKIEQELYHIPVGNGTYILDECRFSPLKFPCRYRLPVNFDPDAPEPKAWLRFLSELLNPEDIDTLQEFMGYCMIPTTKAQKMLIITGNGGEGKSRIGIVMKRLLGANMNQGSVAKVESSPFARADLQHLLLLVDDDLKMEALPSTNNIKAIITAEMPMDLERKGIQSYQGQLNVRFMAFGNGTLRSLYDKSHGFFRRQIILQAKPRPADRVDDPYLTEAFDKELPGIFLWCLEGLVRLIGCNYRFTISQNAKAYMEQAQADANNVSEFLRSEGYFELKSGCSCTSQGLYHCYNDWCRENAYHPVSIRTFIASLKHRSDELGLQYDNHIYVNDRTVRGFRGIRLLL